MFWACFACACFLLSVAGCMSGLTVGYESIDELTLEVKLKNGTPEEQRMALKIMPIIAKHHTLLSTLLITNAVALEALPICIDKIVPSWAAILISAIGVVIVAEIIPMSVCTGPKKLQIAAFCGPFIKVLMCCLWCLAAPSGKILDWLLGGHEKIRYKK